MKTFFGPRIIGWLLNMRYSESTTEEALWGSSFLVHEKKIIQLEQEEQILKTSTIDSHMMSKGGSTSRQKGRVSIDSQPPQSIDGQAQLIESLS